MGKYDNLAALARGSDEAGDAVRQVIAGYLPYNPGPGIYSRLERAVEAMPENVRVQELPGLLKRYKDGVPVWELKETDLDSVVAGRDVVPRSELLARVKERSPVYTHKEVLLGGNPPTRSVWHYDITGPSGETVEPGQWRDMPFHQGEPSPLAGGVAHGMPRFENYGQGGEKYSELLLVDPANPARELPKAHHFSTDYPGDFLDASRATRRAADAGTVAHARYDTHGDALRINEIQSDINNYNIKAQKDRAPRQGRNESDADYQETLQNAGWRFNLGDDGEIVGNPLRPHIPFALEDTWSDLLIRRLALEAARQGHRAIEVVSPRSAAVSGGDLEHLQHLYGKVVPGALERLGRKMGGLVEDVPALRRAETKNVWDESEDLLNQYRRFNQGDPERIDAFNDLLDATSPATQRDAASKIYAMFDDGDPGYATAATRDALALAEQTNAARAVRERLLRQGIGPPRQPTNAPGRRYVMSDEMRRRIIEGGIGASLLAPLASQYGEER